MDIADSLKRVKKIKQAYNVLNRTEGYKTWSASEYMEAFIGDVGDLSKLMLARKGYSFAQKDVDSKVARELADCLWSVLVLAEELDVDIESEFGKMLIRLEDKIHERKVTRSKPRAV